MNSQLISRKFLRQSSGVKCGLSPGEKLRRNPIGAVHEKSNLPALVAGNQFYNWLALSSVLLAFGYAAPTAATYVGAYDTGVRTIETIAGKSSGIGVSNLVTGNIDTGRPFSTGERVFYGASASVGWFVMVRGVYVNLAASGEREGFVPSLQATTAIGKTSGPQYYYHYTYSPNPLKAFVRGFWLRSSFTVEGNLTPSEAMSRLGVKQPPTYVVKVLNKGQFVPAKPEKVPPHFHGPGGANVFENPKPIPAEDIVEIYPIGLKR